MSRPFTLAFLLAAIPSAPIATAVAQPAPAPTITAAPALAAVSAPEPVPATVSTPVDVPEPDAVVTVPAPRWYDTIGVHGFASMGYSFNANRPADDANQLRVFDGDDNTINVDV